MVTSTHTNQVLLHIFCNLQSFDKVLVGRRTNRYSKTINTSMKIEIDFDMGYETNIPWIEAI